MAEGRLNALGLAKGAAGCVDIGGGGGGGGGDDDGGDGSGSGRVRHDQAGLGTGGIGDGCGETPMTVPGVLLEPEEAPPPQAGVVVDAENTPPRNGEPVAAAEDESLPAGGSPAARDKSTTAEATVKQDGRISEPDRATRESEQTRAGAEARLEEVQRQLRREEREHLQVQVPGAIWEGCCVDTLVVRLRRED